MAFSSEKNNNNLSVLKARSLMSEWVNLLNIMTSNVNFVHLSEVQGIRSDMAASFVSQLLFISHVPPCTIPPHHHHPLSTSREAGGENWGTEGCQTLASNTVHTKCLCSRISTYAVLAQQAKDPVSHLCVT